MDFSFLKLHTVYKFSMRFAATDSRVIFVYISIPSYYLNGQATAWRIFALEFAIPPMTVIFNLPYEFPSEAQLFVGRKWFTALITV